MPSPHNPLSKEPFSLDSHRDARYKSDDFAWLRASNWQQVLEKPELLASRIHDFLERENRRTDETMKDVLDVQKKMFDEMKSRLMIDDFEAPIKDGEYAYFTFFPKDQQYPVYCRLKTSKEVDAKEAENLSKEREVLLDANIEAAQSPYFSLFQVLHSPDHEWLAYSVDTTGNENYVLRIQRIADSFVMDKPIAGLQGDFEWSNDSKKLFYVRLNERHRPERICCHVLGTEPSQDGTIYREKDPGFFLSINKTCSRAFITLNAYDHHSSEVWLIHPDSPEQLPILVQKRSSGIRYSVEEFCAKLVIRTNAFGAIDYCLVIAALNMDAGSQITIGDWKVFYRPKNGTYLQDFTLGRGWLACLERQHNVPRITLLQVNTDTLALQEKKTVCIDIKPPYTILLENNNEFDNPSVRYVFSSMCQPAKTFSQGIFTGKKWLRKEKVIPGGFEEKKYTTKLLWALGEQGVRIPISLVHHRDTSMDGSAPLVLYGYGAYGIITEARFLLQRLPLLDRGCIFAIAHVRGGKEMGHHWYEDGKMKHKKNTFTDFIACACFLIASGYVRQGNIGVVGGSAGGMLIGAVLNMCPQLFKVAVAHVPFVDVLSTMSDDTLPLTPPEWLEWGNPMVDKQVYETIRSYSPVDNVRLQHYPHILVTAGLCDPRVTYWEPAKWVAKLRKYKQDHNMLLLKTNMQAGHAGKSGRFDYLKEVTLEYAFLLKAFTKDQSALL